MPDREKVITHLQIIHTWAEFARERDLQFFTKKHLKDIAQWSEDAIAMLKERDAVPVVRCWNCKRRGTYNCPVYVGGDGMYSEPDDWFCGDGERRTDDA